MELEIVNKNIQNLKQKLRELNAFWVRLLTLNS